MDALGRYFIVDGTAAATACSEELAAGVRPFIFIDEIQRITLRVLSWALTLLASFFCRILSPYYCPLIVELYDSALHTHEVFIFKYA